MLLLINNLHTLYRHDPYLQNLCDACDISLNQLKGYIEDIANQLNIDQATWGLDFYEREVAISANKHRSDAERRASIKAKWKSSGKADLALIQAVANSWQNGQIKAEFTNGTLLLTFTGDYGAPTDLEGLYSAIDDIKPAHITVLYKFRYLLVQDINTMKIKDLQKQKIRNFANSEG